MEGRRSIVMLSWLLLIVASTHSKAEKSDSDDDRDKQDVFPRTFGFFPHARQANTDSQKTVSGFGQFSGIFGGGGFGFHIEAQPFAPITGLIDHAKKLIPNPFAPPSGSGKDGKDDQYDVPEEGKKPSSETSWEEENPSDKKPKPWESVIPHIQRPSRPRPNVEEKQDENLEYTTEPIENIIQPRIRPRQRRSIESRIIHVPLEFLSNAKPYQVKIKRDGRHKY